MNDITMATLVIILHMGVTAYLLFRAVHQVVWDAALYLDTRNDQRIRNALARAGQEKEKEPTT